MLNRIIITIALLVSLAVNTTNAQVTYVHEDFMGSVVAESNVLGQITKRSHYEPYGEQRTSTISNEAAYTGHVFDDDLDLSYMGARYYDSSIGRFYSDDPVGFLSSNPASFNRYAYANNNPYAYKDPDGRYGKAILELLKAIGKKLASSSKKNGGGKKGVGQQVGEKSAQKTTQQNTKRVDKNKSSENSKTEQAKTKTTEAQKAKAVRSLEKRIKEHQEKIEKFKKDPSVRPGMENQSKEAIRQQQQRRIEHLETEIRTFRNNIEKINNGSLNS